VSTVHIVTDRSVHVQKQNANADQKASLVDLGLYVLSHGQTQMVQAITHLMATRGLVHE